MNIQRDENESIIIHTINANASSLGKVSFIPKLTRKGMKEEREKMFLSSANSSSSSLSISMSSSSCSSSSSSSSSSVMTMKNSPLSWQGRITLLITLWMMTAGHALLSIYSKTILGEKYAVIEVNLMAAVIQLLFSVYVVLIDKSESVCGYFGWERVYWLLMHSRKALVVSALHCLGLVVAISLNFTHINILCYTIIIQLKPLMVILWSSFVVPRDFFTSQNLTVLQVVFGCVVVAAATNFQQQWADISYISPLYGTALALFMISLSSVTTINCEEMVKAGNVSLCERVFQLSFYLTMAIAMVMFMTYGENESPLFIHWTLYAFLIAFLQAMIGFLVVAALMYTSSLEKTLSTSLAFVPVTCFGSFLLGTSLNSCTMLGCAISILGGINFLLEEKEGESKTIATPVGRSKEDICMV